MRAVPILLLALTACGGAESLAEVPPEIFASSPSYERDVRPILGRYCVECHAEAGVRAKNIAVDTYESAVTNRFEDVCTAVTDEALARFAGKIAFPPRMQRGGRGGTTTTTRACDGSRYSMPPGAMTRLSAREQVVMLRWVEIGAPR